MAPNGVLGIFSNVLSQVPPRVFVGVGSDGIDRGEISRPKDCVSCPPGLSRVSWDLFNKLLRGNIEFKDPHLVRFFGGMAGDTRLCELSRENAIKKLLKMASTDTFSSHWEVIEERLCVPSTDFPKSMAASIRAYCAPHRAYDVDRATMDELMSYQLARRLLTDATLWFVGRGLREGKVLPALRTEMNDSQESIYMLDATLLEKLYLTAAPEVFRARYQKAGLAFSNATKNERVAAVNLLQFGLKHPDSDIREQTKKYLNYIIFFLRDSQAVGPDQAVVFEAKNILINHTQS
jgi:hypothetical protein